MSLFSKSPASWPPSWRYDAGGYVWRFVFTGDGHILGEARDPEQKIASFFCIDEHDGTPVWEGLRSIDDWWVGLETVEAGRFYLHGYRKPDMPQHLGIRAYDLRSGEQLWQNDDLVFVLAREDAVYAAREQYAGLQFYRLSSDDGSVVEELGQDTEQVNRLRQLLNDEEDFTGYRYPEPFNDGHPAFRETASRLARLIPPESVVGPLDVLVESPLLMAAWHESLGGNGSKPLLRQRFLALHLPSGKTVFKDVLLEEAEAPGMDSFLLKDRQLIYIQQRRILTAHDLNGVPS